MQSHVARFCRELAPNSQIGNPAGKSGIYLIFNLINKKVYIGRSGDIGARIGNHRNKLQSGKHQNQALQNDWNAFGSENFVFRVYQVAALEELVTLESITIASIPESERYNIKARIETTYLVRCTEIQKKQFKALGGSDWIRRKIDAAPTTESVSEMYCE